MSLDRIAAADRPNVLWIITDQQQAQAIGAVNDEFHTPNLDRLADDGALFTNCYCTHPQCSPSRSSLVSGQYPHQNGMYQNSGEGLELDPDGPSIGRVFADAGYETAWIGKWHLGEDNAGDLGWDFFTSRNDGEKTWVQNDRETCRAALDYFGTVEEPFFATVSFQIPHPPYVEMAEFTDQYDQSEMTVPENYGDDMASKPAFHRERRAECDLTPEEVREMRYNYATMVSFVDHNVGRVLDRLAERGLLEETVVAFVSDHGDMQGGHGLSHKGVVAYDEILRVPFLLSTPGSAGGGQVVDDVVSTVSLPRTLADVAGLSPDERFEGESLLSPEASAAFFEHKVAYWGEHPYRGVRTPEWKYVDYLLDGVEELYDATTDPGEERNLAGDTEHEAARDELRTRLDAWWADTGGDERVDWATPVADLD
jgi:arylsulfatase A-like enzyme